MAGDKLSSFLVELHRYQQETQSKTVSTGAARCEGLKEPFVQVLEDRAHKAARARIEDFRGSVDIVQNCQQEAVDSTGNRHRVAENLLTKKQNRR